MLGDAAHPMLPHLGQGANQSIEDAFALAAVLRDATPARVPTALRHYAQVRRRRTDIVQQGSRRNGERYDQVDRPGREPRQGNRRNTETAGVDL